jgi:uncharacterized protein YjbI with pentapeptide repeats
LDTGQANFTGARFNLGTVWREGPPLGALGPEGNARDVDLSGVDLTIGFDTEAVLNLQGLDATGARFDGSNLSGARLDGAELQGAQFIETTLSGAYLEEAMMDRADLSRANLEGANLQFTSLQGAILKDANLTGAILRGANLSNADLCGADMRSAKIESAIWTDAITCPDTRWPGGQTLGQ